MVGGQEWRERKQHINTFWTCVRFSQFNQFSQLSGYNSIPQLTQNCDTSYQKLSSDPIGLVVSSTRQPSLQALAPVNPHFCPMWPQSQEYHKFWFNDLLELLIQIGTVPVYYKHSNPVQSNGRARWACTLESLQSLRVLWPLWRLYPLSSGVFSILEASIPWHVE